MWDPIVCYAVYHGVARPHVVCVYSLILYFNYQRGKKKKENHSVGRSTQPLMNQCMVSGPFSLTLPLV